MESPDPPNPGCTNSTPERPVASRVFSIWGRRNDGERPVRALIVSQYYWPEPGGRIPRALAAELHSSGHDVTVLTGTPNYPEGIRHHGYPRFTRRRTRGPHGENLVHVPEFCYHGQSAIGRALNYLTFAAACLAYALPLLVRQDVAYVYGSPVTAGLAPALVRRLGGPRFIVHAQDLWPESLAATGFGNGGASGSVIRVVAESVTRFVYGGASRIIAISDGARHLLGERPYLDASRIVAIPNWADESRAPTRFAASPGSRLRIMYAGNLGPAQALDTVVVAARKCSERGLPVEFDLVGTGSEVLRLQQLADDLENVTLHGRCEPEEMNAFYETADIQLVSLADDPLFAVTIPSKIQQLLYQGLPILCLGCGDAANLVVSAGAGYVSEPGNPTSLVATIEDIIENKSHLDDHARAGAEYYRARLTRESGLRALISELLPEQAP